MLFPKKVKHRKWHTDRKNPNRVATRKATRGTTLHFGSFGLKATSSARIKSNQIESSRKVISRTIGKLGQYWIRIFPDRPYTAKAAEVGMGKGKGDPQGFCFEVEPGRIMFEVDNVTEEVAREALRKAATKLPVTTKIVSKNDL
ncbi:MAG: 50S ribosomal protein L16 [Candidatus Pacebacteria bacterium]|nr:50S ribosomal protein L16 [Candidatus Paceibacterota bacterium]MCD8528213.1 50S ribosomal protein L16 [Candidatus Paceibacterota bacterium]MCD8563852.1 50S ribosomal protein L16 [Candidatus Paceibacterota bacterium]